MKRYQNYEMIYLVVASQCLSWAVECTHFKWVLAIYRDITQGGDAVYTTAMVFTILVSVVALKSGLLLGQCHHVMSCAIPLFPVFSAAIYPSIYGHDPLCNSFIWWYYHGGAAYRFHSLSNQ